MKVAWVSLAAAAAVGAAAAAGGSWLVRQAHHPSVNLHDLVHSRFHLSPAEHARMESAEAAYDRRRFEIEGRIRVANRRLAAAIRADDGMSPEVQAASAQMQTAAGELQRATLTHIFEMRAGLDPAHRAAYDAVVADAMAREP